MTLQVLALGLLNLEFKIHSTAVQVTKRKNITKMKKFCVNSFGLMLTTFHNELKLFIVKRVPRCL